MLARCCTVTRTHSPAHVAAVSTHGARHHVCNARTQSVGQLHWRDWGSAHRGSCGQEHDTEEPLVGAQRMGGVQWRVAAVHVLRDAGALCCCGSHTRPLCARLGWLCACCMGLCLCLCLRLCPCLCVCICVCSVSVSVPGLCLCLCCVCVCAVSVSVLCLCLCCVCVCACDVSVGPWWHFGEQPASGATSSATPGRSTSRRPLPITRH